MVNFYKRSALLLPLLLGSLVSLWSQEREVSFNDSKKELPLEQRVLSIKEVVVSASRLEKEVIPVQELRGEELKRLSVHSVADALRYFSGVQIKDYGGIGGLKTVNIRSMGSHHVGVFYDGVELGNAQNGVIDLGRFSLDNMEAITLYNGQKSAIFQPAKDYAAASALYLVTRKPTFKEETRRNLNIGIKGGSFTTINPSILWEERFGERLSASFSSEFLYTSGKYKFSYSKKEGWDTTEVRKNGDVRMFRAEMALFGKVAEGEWNAKGYYYNSERGYPGASVREEPGKFKHQDRQWDDNLFIQGSYRKRVANYYSLLLNGKYSYDHLHYLSDPRLDVTTMYIDNTYIQQELYFSSAHLFSPISWWSLSLSNDLQWNGLDADLYRFVYPNRYSALTAAATSFQFNRLKLQGSLLHTFVHERTKMEGESSDDKSLFTPTVVASWQPFKRSQFTLRAFYKRIFRMPTLNDLYYTFIGNKALDPEFTTQYNIGFTYHKNLHGNTLTSLQFQLDGYYNEVEDKIIAMPTSNQFRWTMLNLGYVEIRGVDVACQGEFLLGGVTLTPRISYTYQRAEDYTDSNSEWFGGQIPYIPWHSGSVIVSGSRKEWSWNYSFIYTGERYEAVANILENYAQPWYTHDLSLTKNFALKSGDLRATVEVNNIFNQQYEVVLCYPMPGINFNFKINLFL